MAQTWSMPTGSTVAKTAIKTNIPDALEALRTLHSGSSAPSATVAYMLWADTTNALLKIRNSANSAWITVAPLAKDWSTLATTLQWGGLSATTARRVFVAKNACTVSRIVLLSDTATTSSSGNEWQFMLRNMTAAVDLFSGTVGTFTALGGVGGGAEIAIDTAYILTPDQNAAISANDVLRFTCTKVGTATTLVDFMTQLDLTLAA